MGLGAGGGGEERVGNCSCSRLDSSMDVVSVCLHVGHGLGCGKPRGDEDQGAWVAIKISPVLSVPRPQTKATAPWQGPLGWCPRPCPQ